MIGVPHKKREQKIYIPQNDLMGIAMDEQLDYYIIKCPICEKRTMDISDLPGQQIKLCLKCPHCRKIVLMMLGSD